MAVGVQVTDPSGLVATDRTTVTITNAAPVIGTVEALDDAALTSAGELAFVVRFTDAGLSDTRRAVVEVDGRHTAGDAQGPPVNRNTSRPRTPKSPT